MNCYVCQGEVTDETFFREMTSTVGLKFTDERNFFNAISTEVSFFVACLL